MWLSQRWSFIYCLSNLQEKDKLGKREDFMMRKLSAASMKLDRGQKGYLDDFEQTVRKYDKDGDGVFSTEEVFNIVEDMEKQRSKKRVLKRSLFLSITISVVLLMTVFGLMVATVSLTRKVTVDESSDALVSDKTGRTLVTRTEGTHFIFELEDDNKDVDGNEEARVLATTDEEFDNRVGSVNKNTFETEWTNLINSGDETATFTLEGKGTTSKILNLLHENAWCLLVFESSFFAAFWYIFPFFLQTQLQMHSRFMSK